MVSCQYTVGLKIHCTRRVWNIETEDVEVGTWLLVNEVVDLLPVQACKHVLHWCK